MKSKHLLPVLFCAIFSIQLVAQSDGLRDALSWRWAWQNFQYPITENHSTDDYTTGAEVAYSAWLNRWLDVAIPLRFGKADLPLDQLGNKVTNRFIASLGMQLHLNITPTGSLIQPYLLGGASLLAEGFRGGTVNPEFPFGLGLNLRVNEGVYISGESQYRYSLDSKRSQLYHTLGLKFDLDKREPPRPEISDRDNDGISDEEDQCPDQAGTLALMGCPDADGDGVPDAKDECPNESGPPTLGGCPDDDGDKIPNHLDECPTVAGLADNKGCPDEDRDNDGIKDADDKCPDVPGTTYTNGCPDLDGDGIADADDLCPSQTGLPENRGCPDTDSDGVIDPRDKCPDTAGPASNSGCPELKQEEKDVLELAMKDVRFETGSARLKTSSRVVLDQIAEIMRKYPGHKLRISGHTDSIGSAAANLELSEKRAKACYEYLAAKGIDKNRMSYKGYGETQPIADNRFAPGREKNRRVVFEIYVE